jgi:hypothetical protein
MHGEEDAMIYELEIVPFQLAHGMVSCMILDTIFSRA